MALARAALGFRLHTGWAAVIALAGHPDDLQILLRRRVELLPADATIPRFVYHEAAELDPEGSANLVARATATARETARAAVRRIVDELREGNLKLGSACVPMSRPAVPTELSNILASHPLIHRAEGELFQGAVKGACEDCGLQVVTAPERELWTRAAEGFKLDAALIRSALDGLRKSVGSPWAADQKTAAAAALLALTGHAAT